MAGPGDPVGTWPDAAWGLFVAGYESGVAQAAGSAYDRAVADLQSDIKAAGQTLRESPYWPPGPFLTGDALADRAAARASDRQYESLTERDAAVAESWGLPPPGAEHDAQAEAC